MLLITRAKTHESFANLTKSPVCQHSRRPSQSGRYQWAWEARRGGEAKWKGKLVITFKAKLTRRRVWWPNAIFNENNSPGRVRSVVVVASCKFRMHKRSKIPQIEVRAERHSRFFAVRAAYGKIHNIISREPGDGESRRSNDNFKWFINSIRCKSREKSGKAVISRVFNQKIVRTKS